MRMIRLLLLFFVLPLFGIAQERGMVDWKFSAKKVTDQVYEFTVKAVIAENWHIYAQDSGEGSMPTKFTFTANPLVKLEGKVLEQGVLKKSRNEVMQSELRYYEGAVSFVQRVILIRRPMKQVQGDGKGAKAVVLRGTVEFMACNESMCLPPEVVGFSVELK